MLALHIKLISKSDYRKLTYAHWPFNYPWPGICLRIRAKSILWTWRPSTDLVQFEPALIQLESNDSLFDLLNLSHLLCVVKSPSTYNVPRRPRRWFPRGPLIPGTCSSSGSRASRPAAADARPGRRDPVRRHTVGRSSHYWQDTKPCNVLLFWPLGKLQSPFLSQKSTESEVPLQQWRSHGAAIPVIPMSPTSPVSSQPSPSPASPVSLTPPAVSTSPVQATGSNVSFLFLQCIPNTERIIYKYNYDLF